MINELEEARKSLHKAIAIDNGDLLSSEVIKASQRMDKLVVIEQRERLKALGGEDCEY